MCFFFLLVYHIEAPRATKKPEIPSAFFLLPHQALFQRDRLRVIVSLEALHTELPQDIPHTGRFNSLDADL